MIGEIGGLCFASSCVVLAAHGVAGGISNQVISAATGLGGVLLGGAITSWRENRKESKRIANERIYLAIALTPHIDRLVQECLACAEDGGTIQHPPGGREGYRASTTPAPTYAPLDLDVEWKSLPPTLLDESLRRLPLRLQALADKLSNDAGYCDPPEFDYFFHDRRNGYAEIGIVASDLSQKIMVCAGLRARRDTAVVTSMTATLKKIQRDLPVLRAQPLPSTPPS